MERIPDLAIVAGSIPHANWGVGKWLLHVQVLRLQGVKVQEHIMEVHTVMIVGLQDVRLRFLVCSYVAAIVCRRIVD